MSTGGGGAWGFREKEPVPVRSMSESYDIPLNWPADYRARHGNGGEMPSELVAGVLKCAVEWRKDRDAGRPHDAAARLARAVSAYEKWADLKEKTK